AGRALHLEAEGGARTEQVGRRRELQSGIAFSKGDEVAVVDLSRPVILKERAVGDTRDLEVSDLCAVNSVATDDQTRRSLRILVGRRVRDRRSIRNSVNRDRGSRSARTQVST